ncbi:MAG TPA: dTMP kinase [Thermoplasmata archaeon]|nr:dTMP kinase [Thermoplasmata archaeon]
MAGRGTYVVIDGIDGTGKTELAARLVPPLLRRGHSVSSFRSPTDKFLRKEYARLAKSESFAAALCFAVDRAMLRPEIEAAILQGDVVVQDRSYYSALAYLSPALSLDQFRELERIEQALSAEPDLILYLDVPIDLAIRRMAESGQTDATDDATYLQRVKTSFEQMFQPPRWIRIDSSQNPEHTLTQAMNALLSAGL